MLNKVDGIYNPSLPLLKNEDSQSASQSAEETTQSGPYLTVEDPESGYKYIYIVIGKHFKQLISCQPMEGKKNASQKGINEQQKIQQAVKGDAVQNRSNIINTQFSLFQYKQPKPYLQENLLEKIRIWEQCALLDKSKEKFDARG